jgi:hypothetical protein
MRVRTKEFRAAISGVLPRADADFVRPGPRDEARSLRHTPGPGATEMARTADAEPSRSPEGDQPEQPITVAAPRVRIAAWASQLQSPRAEAPRSHRTTSVASSLLQLWWCTCSGGSPSPCPGEVGI